MFNGWKWRHNFEKDEHAHSETKKPRGRVFWRRNSDDITFPSRPAEQDTPFQQTDRFVTALRFPHAKLDEASVHRLSGREVISILGREILQPHKENGPKSDHKAYSLLFQFLETALKDSNVKLPDVLLAIKWLKAREELDQLEVRQSPDVAQKANEERILLLELIKNAEPSEND